MDLNLAKLIDHREALRKERDVSAELVALKANGQITFYIKALKAKWEATGQQYDGVDPKESNEIVRIQAMRHVYATELQLIENCEYIKNNLDEQLSELDKQIGKTRIKGNDGVSKSVPPKGK